MIYQVYFYKILTFNIGFEDVEGEHKDENMEDLDDDEDMDEDENYNKFIF